MSLLKFCENSPERFHHEKTNDLVSENQKERGGHNAFLFH